VRRIVFYARTELSLRPGVESLVGPEQSGGTVEEGTPMDLQSQLSHYGYPRLSFFVEVKPKERVTQDTTITKIEERK
jgi:hypothetical protein